MPALQCPDCGTTMGRVNAETGEGRVQTKGVSLVRIEKALVVGQPLPMGHVVHVCKGCGHEVVPLVVPYKAPVSLRLGAKNSRR